MMEGSEYSDPSTTLNSYTGTYNNRTTTANAGIPNSTNYTNNFNSYDSSPSQFYNSQSSYRTNQSFQYNSPSARFSSYRANSFENNQVSKPPGHPDFRTNIWGVLNGAICILNIMYSSTGILAQGGGFLKSTLQVIKFFASFSSTVLGRITGIFYVRKLLKGLASGETNWAMELTEGGASKQTNIFKALLSEKSLKLLRLVALFGFVLSMIFKNKEEKKYKEHQQAWQQEEEAQQIISQKAAENFEVSGNNEVQEISVEEQNQSELDNNLENNFTYEFKQQNQVAKEDNQVIILENNESEEFLVAKNLNESMDSLEDNSTLPVCLARNSETSCQNKQSQDNLIPSVDYQDDQSQLLGLASILNYENSVEERLESVGLVIKQQEAEKTESELPITSQQEKPDELSAPTEKVLVADVVIDQQKPEETAYTYQPSVPRPKIYVPVVPEWQLNPNPTFELPSMLKTVSSKSQSNSGKSLPWLKKSQNKISS
mmetsp:Transcript_71099/g.82750  ORF Transcript_71099/g.82750 Transcript_71099/m.82750 type:complete len:487 (-) Transcript_71099:88-1548(-)